MFHPIYDAWMSDACTSHVCTRDREIVTTEETCEETTVAPNPWCDDVALPADCCPVWKCRWVGHGHLLDYTDLFF